MTRILIINVPARQNRIVKNSFKIVRFVFGEIEER